MTGPVPERSGAYWAARGRAAVERYGTHDEVMEMRARLREAVEIERAATSRSLAEIQRQRQRLSDFAAGCNRNAGFQ